MSQSLGRRRAGGLIVRPCEKPNRRPASPPWDLAPKNGERPDLATLAGLHATEPRKLASAKLRSDVAAERERNQPRPSANCGPSDASATIWQLSSGPGGARTSRFVLGGRRRERSTDGSRPTSRGCSLRDAQASCCTVRAVQWSRRVAATSSASTGSDVVASLPRLQGPHPGLSCSLTSLTRYASVL